jgi:hypothetical protein
VSKAFAGADITQPRISLSMRRMLSGLPMRQRSAQSVCDTPNPGSGRVSAKACQTPCRIAWSSTRTPSIAQPDAGIGHRSEAARYGWAIGICQLSGDHANRRGMLKIRTKRRADQAAHAATRLAQIEASIAALENEDLLDLADIFKNRMPTPLGEMASAEMTKRSISL